MTVHESSSQPRMIQVYGGSLTSPVVLFAVAVSDGSAEEQVLATDTNFDNHSGAHFLCFDSARRLDPDELSEAESVQWDGVYSSEAEDSEVDE